MISPQEASQQKLLSGAIALAVVLYVAIVSSLAVAWIVSGQNQIGQSGMLHETVSRATPETGSK